MIMLALGYFRFSMDTAAYEQLRRTSEYRWPSQERLGRRPARQFLGPGNETIELPGVIYPHFAGGVSQVERMRYMAGQGVALTLMGGDGLALGKWCIERIEETRSNLLADGTPKKIEFRLSLARYGEDS